MKEVEQPYCFKCGKPLAIANDEYCFDCGKYKKSFAFARSVFVYDEVTKPSMTAFKYKNRREYSQFYVDKAVEKYGELLINLNLDGIVPVPVHSKKRKERGYNQAELLAKGIGKKLEIPVYPNYLVRNQYTMPQKELNNIERLKNLEKAFHISENIVKLNHILVVDDIYTTGATLEACSRILLKRGIEKVYGLTICTGYGL